jgi:uncharacterized protein YqfB (UPF0267 family)
MNEYKIITLRDDSENIIKCNEEKLRRFLNENYSGEIQKILRHRVKVTVKKEGESEFKDFKTAW